MAETWNVRLPLSETADRIEGAIVNGNITGELINRYLVEAPGGGRCYVMVFEKHYARAGNRLTLTVVLDDMQPGVTRVHTASGGGGEGFFSFDWGAADNFERSVRDALADSIIP